MKRSYAASETSKIILGIHVGEEPRVKCDHGDVEPDERVAQAEPSLGERRLEHRQRPRAPVRTGQRPARRHGGVPARRGELAHRRDRQQRHSRRESPPRPRCGTPRDRRRRPRSAPAPRCASSTSGKGSSSPSARLPTARRSSQASPSSRHARSASVSPSSRARALGEPKRVLDPPTRSTPVRARSATTPCRRSPGRRGRSRRA